MNTVTGQGFAVRELAPACATQAAIRVDRLGTIKWGGKREAGYLLD